MIRRKQGYTQLQGVPVTAAEFYSLGTIAQSEQMPALKALYERMLKRHQDLSFKLRESDPEFIQKHRSLAEQVYGVLKFLQMIEEAGKKVVKEED